jgi:hypothetical protein
MNIEKGLQNMSGTGFKSCFLHLLKCHLVSPMHYESHNSTQDCGKQMNFFLACWTTCSIKLKTFDRSGRS